ncbi:FecR domain-containing protein [Achromobacter sp.]|uniref:FecR domain-containing protein n=1 Tax=Achromobacter sp. TaxID=134375 RepID=UPI003C741648
MPQADIRRQRPAAPRGPIDPAIVRRASEWMARLWSDRVDAADIAACEQWRAAHPDHERAWSRLRAMDSKLEQVAGAAGRHVLLESGALASASRRKAVRALGLGVLAAGAAYALQEAGGWRTLTADYRTGVGEIRGITLADGTHVVLNTGSAIDVRFDGQERRVELLGGEILVTTAPDPGPAHRPFRVQSRQGLVQALGTRFTVRDDGRFSHVAVFEGAVDVYPGGPAGSAAIRVQTGQRTSFDSHRAEAARDARESDAAWSRGVLVAENMRVADFLAELGRYRPGILRWDPTVADLRVTGVFSLRDTDRALDALALGLPVTVRTRSRYWVTVSPKTGR